MRMRDLMCNFIFALVLIVTATSAFAYDVDAIFNQDKPEIYSGFFLECGGTKGGPYPSLTDCGKPTQNADKTFTCQGKNFVVNPLSCVVSNYNSAKVKVATSAETTLNIAVSPPTNLKLVIVITTVSKMSRYGNIIASTTIKRTSVSADKVVKEGTSSYRNSKGEYVTNTTIVSG